MAALSENGIMDLMIWIRRKLSDAVSFEQAGRVKGKAADWMKSLSDY